VLFTNPRATRSYGDDFALCNLGQWGEGDAPDQFAALDHAVAMGWADPRRVGVMGLSYGGYMVNWLIGHSTRFRAAVSENGISNILSAYGTSDGGWYFIPLELGAEPDEDPERYARLSPLSAADRIQTPLLLLQSEDDWNCPIEQGEQLYTALKRRGRTVEMVRFAGEGHIMTTAGKPLARLLRRHHLLRWFRTNL
jgi:dipeptidyl aminopeptidase/acylaminoacyl peptidase